MAQALNHEARAQTALQLLCTARGVSAGQLYLGDPDNLQLSASQGELPALPNTAQLAHLMRRAVQHEDALDEMATDALSDDAVANRSFVQLGDTEFELLLLSSMVDGIPTHAGVAVIATGADDMDPIRQSQLLSSLAAQLLMRAPLESTRLRW